LILSDDHSAEFLGASGNPVIQTPNLDRFASQGMRCTRMFTAAPQCVPSRAAFLTGRSPVAVRMGRFTAPLPADVRTFAEDLRDAGYFTGVCRRNYHLDGAGGGPVSGPIYRKHGLQTFRRRMDYVDISPPGQTVARVNEFFDRKPSGKPFFLWVNFNDPHYPWDRDAIPRPHDRKRIPIPGYLPDLPGVREDLGRYYDEIARMDGEFQSVLDILDRRGFAKDTLVLFLGDNGFPMPHGKGTLYDPGLNVPCLARWPGHIRAGAVSDALLSGEDLGPAFLEAAGLPVPKQMSGRSFLSVLRGRDSQTREHVFAARLTHGSRPFKEGTTTHTFDLSRMARSSRYKLIYNCTPHMKYSPVDSYTERSWLEMVDEHLWGRLDPAFDRTYFGARPVLELYDLEADPAELNNLAGRKELASVQRQLLEALQEKMILDWDFLPLPLNE
ncbi:MAG: sulfatase, partial [Armatimonadota bacterium]|nr:sulfatase [Armatimonadota bacterium]